jgi:predicted DNA-binding ArsR family transcriptional regulator
LVKQQEEEFMMNGGDPSWLEGIESTRIPFHHFIIAFWNLNFPFLPELDMPPKLQSLLEVNAVLAHQPWLIKASHVAKLLRGDDPFTRWTTAELVQAFVLMAGFRALAGLVGGLGINPEVDFKHHRDGFSSTSSPNGETVYDISSEDVTQNTQQIIDKLKKALIASALEDDCVSTAEERRARFVEAEETSAVSGTASGTVTPGGSSAQKLVHEGWGEFAKCTLQIRPDSPPLLCV